MKKVRIGIDVLTNDINLQKTFNGSVALLCHNASIDSSFTHAAVKFKEIFGLVLRTLVQHKTGD